MKKIKERGDARLDGILIVSYVTANTYITTRTSISIIQLDAIGFNPLRVRTQMACIPQGTHILSPCHAREEPHPIPIRDADELGSVAFGENRYRIAQKRLWNSRKRRWHGWIRNLVKRQYRVQLSCFRRLQNERGKGGGGGREGR